MTARMVVASAAAAAMSLALEERERFKEMPVADMRKELDCVPVAELEGPQYPPRRLSLNPRHPDYHPSYCRVGVRLNGEERTDVEWYDQDAGVIRTVRRVEHKGEVEAYWRYPETRQQRRARERWEAKHG